MGDLHTKIRETYLKGDVEGALDFIDGEVLDRIAFTGTPENVRRKYQEYKKLGIGLAVIRNVIDRRTGNGPVMENIDALTSLMNS